VKFGLAGIAAIALTAAGCKEDLSAPGHCPELCPGQQIPVFDTTIVAEAASDSSFFGFLPKAARQGLLVSNGLPAGEARAFVVFPAIRSDSFSLDGVFRKFTVDSADFTFTLQARDSTAKNLKIYLHKIPITVDSSITIADLEAAIAAGPIIDSILVPDSVKTGAVTTVLKGTELDFLTTSAADSGKIGLGLTVAASKPTGVRLALDPLNIASTAPLFEIRGRVDISDTTRQSQVASVRATNVAKTGFVFEGVTTPDPDLLEIGGLDAGRALLRFSLPTVIKDSAQLLRATLELTPARPLLGLPGSSMTDSVSARGVLVDLGAKSPPLSAASSPTLTGLIQEGTTAIVSIDLLPLVLQWRSKSGPPPVVLLTHNLENAGFMRPAFFSTRSPTGRPRLRITYALPTGSNTP
jgi:hypothetical protein